MSQEEVESSFCSDGGAKAPGWGTETFETAVVIRGEGCAILLALLYSINFV